mmetsp:Transcript_7329/g.17915  ORF Transcript_7329/g.17915 Transcript_7329/m.17915 type:complete len:168 (+) Transcript_7329:666-1169(+)
MRVSSDGNPAKTNSASKDSSSRPIKLPPAFGVAASVREAQQQPPRDASRLCKCKKSKCIRQYCICFRAGVLCQGCDCVECLNDGDHEEERQAVVDHIKTLDPWAFVDKLAPEEGAGAGAAAPAPVAALARPWRRAFVFSGSIPATIFCGLTVMGPVTPVTSPMTLFR